MCTVASISSASMRQRRDNKPVQHCLKEALEAEGLTYSSKPLLGSFFGRALGNMHSSHVIPACSSLLPSVHG